MSVTGSVSPLFTESDGITQTFAYELSGADPLCASGAGPDLFSCGIHLHTGYSCEEGAGSHYYVNPPVTSDPWEFASYTTVNGTASGVFSVTTGASDVAGRALIIHGYAFGERQACALLQPVPEIPALKTSGFVPYFSYSGALAVSGTVVPVVTTDVTQSFAYDLSDVDTACSSGAGTAANSCGIHIHSGSTCVADAGGHYFTGTVTADPWTSISYTSVGGAASGVVTVTTGGTGADIEGRAMVVHGFDGGRIACALLVPLSSPTMSPSISPTVAPSSSPSASPSVSPSVSPSASPSASPSESPSASPSMLPTGSPIASPSMSPTASPAAAPSDDLLDATGCQAAAGVSTGATAGIALGAVLAGNLMGAALVLAGGFRATRGPLRAAGPNKPPESPDHGRAVQMHLHGKLAQNQA